jgi:heterodisulfide reductase subunit C
MDVVRQMARLRGKKIPIKEPRVFQDVFLKSVEHNGRLFEPGMIAFYNLRSGDLFHDVNLGPKMLLKGKLPLLPHTSKNREKLREIFRKAEACEMEAGRKTRQEGPHKSGR